MSKANAVSKLTIKISKTDMSDYSDVLYQDIADPAINGIAAHALLTNVHGLPAIVASINAEFDDVWDALDTKLGAGDINLSGKADVSGDTFTGSVAINTLSDHLVLDGQPSVRKAIYSKTNGLKRWEFALASNEIESGSNNGSNFSVARFNDDGTFIDAPFTINRRTGTVYVKSLSVGGGDILVGASVDIRKQFTEPTENLQVGTVWLRSAEAVIPN